MPMDMPNALAQNEVLKGDEIITMKIRGALAHIPLEIDPEKYKDFAIGEGRNEVFHSLMLKSLCGMLMASVSCCNNFKKDFEAEGYQVKTCGIFVSNEMVKENRAH